MLGLVLWVERRCAAWLARPSWMWAPRACGRANTAMYPHSWMRLQVLRETASSEESSLFLQTLVFMQFIPSDTGLYAWPCAIVLWFGRWCSKAYRFGFGSQ